MACPFHGAVYDQVASATDDLEFWRRCVQAAGGSILELGVGTGRLALHLARLTTEYHGLEVDPTMLARLQAKMRDECVPIELHEGSFIDLGRQFALVFIPANTISHVVDHDEAERFFRAVRRPRYDHPSQVTTHRLEYEKSNAIIDTRELRQRSFYPAELTAWLRSSGFNHVEHYGSYDESPLEWNSSRVIVAAT